MPGPLGFTGVTVDPNWAWNTLGWNNQVNTGGDVEETSSVSSPNGPAAGFLAIPMPQLVTSNTNVTNPNATLAVNVIVSGGSGLTSVSVGSNVVGTGAGTYNVPGGSTFKVTYSSVPTLTTLNAAPAVPATTVAATNTSGLTAQVTMTAGATGTAVVINGNTVAVTILIYAQYFVPPGGTITLTYSAGTPTWIWQLLN